MIERLHQYLDKYAALQRATRLCCFRVFGENFTFEILAFFVIFR
ncbi:hypothetical protein T10_2867 [Trichinella papuae]|uniref:Uncharacterized protein n=1 Tax=Trichinella papuae TaxID=268474 RepID=A0A0V1LXV0_9BILA|nr:hypothetical protein T10_2867 [Trichinella papuae]